MHLKHEDWSIEEFDGERDAIDIGTFEGLFGNQRTQGLSRGNKTHQIYKFCS